MSLEKKFANRRDTTVGLEKNIVYLQVLTYLMIKYLITFQYLQTKFTSLSFNFLPILILTASGSWKAIQCRPYVSMYGGKYLPEMFILCGAYLHLVFKGGHKMMNPCLTESKSYSYFDTLNKFTEEVVVPCNFSYIQSPS